MILITGSQGQLGQELCHLLDELGTPYVASNSTSMDITDYSKTLKYIEEAKPSIIYHCAAYTAVDNAEDVGKDMNYLVNVEGTKNVAKVARKVGATLVYVSTDYVFDGTNVDGEYLETAETNPMNEYGKSKLLGEQAVVEAMQDSDYYIIRTSWVFGEFGNNFVYTMKRLANNMDRLTIVNDQYGRPTWTKTLAEFMVYLTDNNSEYGMYHLSNDGSCTWFEFAKEILKENTDIELVPVTSQEFPQKAYRPKYSVMDLSKAKATGFKIISWQEALDKFLLNNTKNG